MESIALKFLLIYDTVSESTEKRFQKPSEPPTALPHSKKLDIAFNFRSDVNQGWITGLLKEHFFGLPQAGNYASSKVEGDGLIWYAVLSSSGNNR